ncbi:MAG: hypothetical protein VXY93_16310, partial [Pseudomonadota bacterium]|nr:hypothetical protein [Pseudomonadota bacterium]
MGGNLDLNSKDINGTGNITYTGNFKATGIATAGTFSGSGASLTSLPAGQLTGTVADARISALTASKLTGALPAISGANLTNIDAFKTISVSGQSSVVADSVSDTLTLVAGSNMTITTNAGGDSITFASSGGGAGVTVQDEGSALSTTATTLNFVGSGVVASGNGATKTITIAGGSGSNPGFSTAGGSFTVNAGVTTVINTFNINTNTKLSEYTIHLENVN